MKPRTLLAVATTVALTAVTASSAKGDPARADSSALRRSVVVRVAAPSVYEVVAGHVPDAAWRTAPGRDTKLGRLVREAEAGALRAQEPIVRAAEAAGATVVSRYVAATNGLLVHGTDGQMAVLRRLPGVRDLEPAPRARPQLSRTVPRVGADAFTSATGYEGDGTIIAVIDSGIDYTHAAFGGPGTVTAYEAAAAEAERIDDEYEGARLFPTEKVIGGWDFVGPNYTSPEMCPPPAAAAGMCTSDPDPDPDPLDQAGHGTHVSSAAAGLAAGGVGAGVAPGARLLALKVYGPPRNPHDIDEAADVLIDAIDWCVRVNLGLDVPGTVPEARETIDVVNMSLGEPYGQGSRLYDEVIDAAVNVGIVVVAAAGNGQDRPFVTTSPGTSPRALSVASITLGADPGLDTVSGHSGRGPSRHGALKPDLSAPGAGILSAAVGTGDGGAPSSGTSLAAPHVAGAAALLAQRSEAEALGLSALDIAAMLVNSSVPIGGTDGGPSAPSVTRQGAGRLAVDRSATSPLVARAGDVASLNLGALSLTEPRALERAIELRNVGTEDVRVRVTAAVAGPGPAHGITVVVPGSPLVVEARGRREVPIVFHIAPERLAPWPGGAGTLDAGDLDGIEVVGRVEVTPVDQDARPRTDLSPAGVPFYVLPRAASDIAVAAADREHIRLRNGAPSSGTAELFVLPHGGRDPDPAEEDVWGEVDMRRVGVRFDDVPEGGQATLRFGVALQDAPAVPWMTVLALYLDLDGDGSADFRVRAGPESALTGGLRERAVVTVTAWDGDAGAPAGAEVAVGTRSVDLHARVFTVAVPLAAFGREEPFAFRFYAVHTGLGEDWLFGPRQDLVPDGAQGPCGGAWLSVDPSAWGRLPETWSVLVPGGAAVAVARAEGAPGAPAPALLALVSGNRFEIDGAQAIAILDGADPEPPRRGGCHAFLPSVSRHHVIKKTSADALFADSLDAAAAQQWLKLEYTVTDYRDADQDARRTYRFRNPDGMRYTLAPLDTDYYWDFIRVENEAFVLRHREGREELPWRCTPVDEWMLFWPQFLLRYRTEFPSYGWRIADRGTPGDPDTWTLHNQGPPGVTHVAKVNVPTGLPVLLSRKDPAVRLDVYKLYDFGLENHGLSRPRVVACP